MKAWLKAMVAAAFLAAVFSADPAIAEEQKGDDEGIPAYSVARLKVFSGTAWVRTSDSGEWEEFATNSPVPERARISVPDGAEAELQFHGGQGVLLTAGSEIDVTQLADQRSSFRLRSGEIRLDLREADFAPVRVSIPGGGKVAFPVPGGYWMTAGDDGETRLVVRRGQGTVSNDRGDFTVKAGEEALIGADVQIGPFAGGAGSDETSPPLSDAEREAGIPPYAADELREYGEWVESGDYGYVWRPRAAAGWSPYFYGRWDWVSPYGWTWISFEPWGWWPYHFGYWHSDPFFGWVWSPYGSFVSVGFTFGSFHTSHFLSRCTFAPATVRFIGDGRNVRWVPLRPGERGGRVAFTRSDARLAGWKRPLSRGTVFVRQGGDGSRMWRDYSSVRGERRPVVSESVGRRAPGSAPDMQRGREIYPGSKERTNITGPGRPDIAPRPERMDREGQPPRRGRDSRIERRYYGAGGAGASIAGEVQRESRPKEYAPRASGRQAEHGRESGSMRPPARREATPAAGFERRAESVAPRSDREGDADLGGRFSVPASSSGTGRGAGRGAGREATGFGSRGGGDWGGGRGGR